MLISNNSNIDFNTVDNFTVYGVTEDEKTIINKDIYNYSDIDILKDLGEEDRQKIIQYYNIISKNSDINEITEELQSFCDENMFSYNQWNIFKKYAEFFQKYMKNNFTREYNFFITSVFNLLFIKQMDNYNTFIEKVNDIYKNNLTYNGSQAFKGIEIKNFTEDLQLILNNFLSEKTSKINRVIITKDNIVNTNNMAHIIKIK